MRNHNGFCVRKTRKKGNKHNGLMLPRIRQGHSAGARNWGGGELRYQQRKSKFRILLYLGLWEMLRNDKAILWKKPNLQTIGSEAWKQIIVDIYWNRRSFSTFPSISLLFPILAECTLFQLSQSNNNDETRSLWVWGLSGGPDILAFWVKMNTFFLG